MAAPDGNTTSALCLACPYRERICENIDLRSQLGAARSLADKLRGQLEEKDQEIARLKALLRKREHQAFGRKSEKKRKSGTKRNQSESSAPKSAKQKRKKRGQQPGNPTPERRRREHLQEVHVSVSVPEEERCCPQCGLSLEPFGDPEVTTTYELVISVRKVVTSKERLRCTCGCGTLPGIVTPATLGPLFPGSQLGSSLWAEILSSRYVDGQPMGAVLRRLQDYGMDLPAGTIHGATPRLLSLFEPLFAALCSYNRLEHQWHADETGMKVWLSLPEDTGSAKWWLWTFVAGETTIFLIDSRRSHEVPLEYLGKDAEGTIIADRHSAYKKFARLAVNIVLAFCWAHARRDFLDTAREWPMLESWCFDWRDRISELFHLNQRRCDADRDSPAFRRRQGALKRAVATFFDDVRTEHAQPDQHPEKVARLESLLNHEEGLRVFVDNPAVAMDNNTAERALRPQVLARQLFYGCQSQASATLRAQLASIFTTLQRQGVSVRSWLHEYLLACAQAGGKPPADAATYLTRHLPGGAAPASSDAA